MDMICHEAVSHEFEAALCALSLQELKVPAAVLIIGKKRLAVVAHCGHVKVGVRFEVKSRLSR